MKLGSENLSAKEMWNKETICERTWECLFRMAKYARGQSTEKPKAGVLYQQKEGMYWWIIRLIPDFISIYSYWHHISNAAIQKAALQYGFEKSFRPKHDLTGAELSLFWDQIPRFRVGLDNWKQHYAAWVTVWITSVRPGSLTTCVGYEKDSLLGDNKSRRAEDETLRWSDMQFFRLNDGGIGCKIQFRFIKGARDPYSRKVVHGTRRFTILPLNGDQYHLDLALLMTALAYSRGLFANVASPEDLFSGTLVNIAKDPRIDQQAVFVASDQSNTLLQNQPMHEKHLTPKLQEMCTAVGLLQRNTMYSLRRTAITESRRKHGTEHAQDLAFHARGGASIYAYDDLAYQDFDIANDRNNLDGMSRTQIREMFSQAATSRIDITDDALMGFGDSEANLQKKFNTESMRRARTDPTNIANEASLRDLRNEATQLLLSLGVVEEFLVHDQDIRDHLSNQAATSEECKAKHNDIQMLEATNKTTLRRLQAQYKKIIKTELQKEIEKNQQVIARKKRSTLGTSGSISGPEREAQGPEGEDLAGFDTDARANVDNLNTDESEEGDEALEHEGSEDVAEEQADHTRTEPAQWEQLPEEIVIHQEADEDSKDPTLAGRLQFIKDFVATVHCHSCHLIVYHII